MDITIEGILTGAILPMAGYFVFHWLATKREGNSRKTQASNSYREKIILACSELPSAEEHWGMEVAEAHWEAFRKIAVASEVYKYFLSPTKVKKFENTLKLLENLVTLHMPSSLAKDNIIYPVNARKPQQVKSEFRSRIEELLLFANET